MMHDEVEPELPFDAGVLDLSFVCPLDVPLRASVEGSQ
jgi:hypothetical protein